MKTKSNHLGTKEKHSDFIATFVHELKAPVTSIKEAVSLLSDINKKNFDIKTKRVISIAQEEINRLARMIDNVLEVSSIEAGKLHLVHETVNINDVINQVIESQSLVVQRKRIQVKRIFKADNPIIIADKDRLFETIANLLDNALKFTPEKGTITVTSQILKSNAPEIMTFHLNSKLPYCKVTISDTGPGILKKDLERIFEKFERTKLPGKIKGIGLGLTIARNIIELHHGKIWATSQSNKGANFHFVLPI